MHTEKRDAPDPNFNYEVRDVNYKGLRTANIIFFLFAIGAAFVGYLLYHFWANPAIYRTQGKTVERILPNEPNPRLQDNVTAKTDIMDMRQAEIKKLDGAPVQKQDGTYQIPINAAKQMIVEAGGKTPEELTTKTSISNNGIAPSSTTDTATGAMTTPLPAGTGTGQEGAQ